jgi:LAGLIDADG endonuclease
MSFSWRYGRAGLCCSNHAEEDAPLRTSPRHEWGITPAHVAGLVVGEGCFYAESREDPKYLSGWRIRPAFCLEMRADDRAALELVQAQLNCGHLYDLDFGRYEGYEERGWKAHVKYRVTRLSDLHDKVVPFFSQHRLFGRKREAFELFAELVQLMYRKAHLESTGLFEAKALAARLAEHNRRGW